MNDVIKTLLETLIPCSAVIVGLFVFTIKLHIRNKKICEIANVMIGEYGMILATNKNNKECVELKPDFRKQLQETYNRCRKLDIDKER